MSRCSAETATGQCRRNASHGSTCWQHGGSQESEPQYQLSGEIEAGEEYDITKILKMLNLPDNHVFFYHASHGDHAETALKLMTIEEFYELEEFDDNAYLRPEFIGHDRWEVEYDDDILRLYFSGPLTVPHTSSESYVIRGLSRAQVETFLGQINLGQHLEYLFND